MPRLSPWLSRSLARALRWRWWQHGLGGAAVFVFAASCESNSAPAKGQLMMALQTDMSLPKDVDEVRIEVQVYGNTLFANTYQVGSGALSIPATFAVVAGKDPATPVTLRVSARQQGKSRMLREVVTTVPADRIASLRVPISWLCDGSATNATGDSNQVQSTCPEGQTCVAGACAPSEVNATELPAYTPEAVFGGGTTGVDGSCFDVDTCFQDSLDANLDLATCTTQLASLLPARVDAVNAVNAMGTNVIDKTNVNFAIKTGEIAAAKANARQDGICGASACYIPLDAETPEGWSSDANVAGLVHLPAALCKRMQEKKAASLVVSTTCAAKPPSVPTCGPWSSVPSTRAIIPLAAAVRLRCPDGRKRCGTTCVAVDNPAFGCTLTQCAPCPAGPAGQAATCAQNACVTAPVSTPPAPVDVLRPPTLQPAVGGLLVNNTDNRLYWTSLEGVRAVDKLGGAPVTLATPPTQSPYQKAGPLVVTAGGQIVWLADGKLHRLHESDGGIAICAAGVTQQTVCAPANATFPALATTADTVFFTWPDQGQVMRSQIFSDVTVPPSMEIFYTATLGVWGVGFLEGPAGGQNRILWSNEKTGEINYAVSPVPNVYVDPANTLSQARQNSTDPTVRWLAINDKHVCGTSEVVGAPSQLRCVATSELTYPPPPNGTAPAAYDPRVGIMQSLVLDGDYAWVGGDAGLVRVNLGTGRFDRVPTQRVVGAVAVDATTVYWADGGSQQPPQFSLKSFAKALLAP